MAHLRASEASGATRDNAGSVKRDVVAWKRRLKCAAYCVGAADPAEKRLDVVDDGVLDEGRTGLLRRVVDEDTEVFPEQRVADGGFDADIRCNPGDDERADIPLAQQQIKIRACEPAVARLRHDQIGLLHRQGIDKLEIPASFSQDLVA